MAKRIASVYLARMVGDFKDILPLRRGIVYRRGREITGKLWGLFGEHYQGTSPDSDSRAVQAARAGGRGEESLVDC
jgi:hypothetical protein